VIEYIVSPLTHIINSCIKNNIFPQTWKVSRISPIPKTDNPSENNDYRPVAILPILSKVYESLVLRQMQEFIGRFCLYMDTQSGFRKGHSTATTLLKFKDDITKAMKKGEITLAIFADYSKAFDTVDFEILISKLYKLNYSKSFLHWLVSYLTNRQQYVKVNDKSSTKITTMFGVPQGSILGPVLFNLYVADMQRNIDTQESCLQYADDSTFYQHCKVNDIAAGKSNLEESLSNICNWSTRTNLIFIESKTKMMMFAPQQMARYHNLDRENGVEITVNSKPVERVSSWKVLGMLFQQNLLWNNHITELTSSCYGVLAVLRKLKRFTPFHIRKQLAEALVLYKLDYCNVLCNALPTYLIKRLQRVQNAAAGFVQGRYANTENVLDIKWLPVKERIEFSMAKFTFKSLHFGNWPSYLSVHVKHHGRV
jgi:retron-type reverse transcriptase